MKLIDNVKYDYKHYVKSKPKLFLAIFLKLLGILVGAYFLKLVFPQNPLSESTGMYSIFIAMLSIAIAIVTFNEHAHQGYVQYRRNKINEFKEKLLTNDEDRYTMNEVYNMLPESYKSVFIKGMFESEEKP